MNKRYKKATVFLITVFIIAVAGIFSIPNYIYSVSAANVLVYNDSSFEFPENARISSKMIEQARERADLLATQTFYLQSGGQEWDIPVAHHKDWFLFTASKKNIDIDLSVPDLAAFIDGTIGPKMNKKMAYSVTANDLVPQVSLLHADQVIYDAEKIALAMNQSLETNDYTLDLEEILRPSATLQDSDNFGIKELLATGESYFKGSSANRVSNIRAASAPLDNLLIAPGESVSFLKLITPMTYEKGFRNGLIIQDGKVVSGWGGGTCQVSTTLYRAILNAGLTVEQRTAHSIRVGYYEQESYPGLDATVFLPRVDLKFRNDTGNNILITRNLDEANNFISFSIWGTKDRSVRMEGPEYLTKSKRKVNWHRYIQKNDGTEETKETFYTRYSR